MSGKLQKNLDRDGRSVLSVEQNVYAIFFLPRENTILEHNDRLTIIGEPQGLEQIRRRYRPVTA